MDRTKDFIVSGGENISSLEIERVLYDHPAVLAAAVVARVDERWGEVPVGLGVLKPGLATRSEELRQHCQTQLAKFKCPAEFVFLDELPPKPSGKVRKPELRERLQQQVPSVQHHVTRTVVRRRLLIEQGKAYGHRRIRVTNRYRT